MMHTFPFRSFRIHHFLVPSVWSLVLLVLTFFMSAGVASAASSVQTVLSFDSTKGELAENLAIDRQGTIYVSLSLSGTIRVLRQDGQQARLQLPVGDKGAVAGLALSQTGQLYAAVSSTDRTTLGIWRFNSNGKSERVASLPEKAVPNGITFDERGNLYIADSALGTIWRLPPGKTEIEAWAVDTLLAPDPNGIKIPGLPNFPVPGANGVKVFRGALYVSNSSRASILRIPLGINERHGTISVAYSNVVDDDFALDERGNLYTVTNIFSNQLNRIHPNGTTELLATAKDGLDGPSAVAFGTQPGTRTTLYITNLAVAEYLQGQPGHSSLEKLDVGITGCPFV